MYTIGYGWTYGCAILARSSTVLAVGMAFHLSQLLFLILVEEPHVKKQQEMGLGGKASGGGGAGGRAGGGAGGGKSPSSSTTKGTTIEGATPTTPTTAAATAAAAAAAAKGPRGSNVFLVKNFDLFRASDVSLLLMCMFFVVAMWLGSFPGGPLDKGTG